MVVTTSTSTKIRPIKTFSFVDQIISSSNLYLFIWQPNTLLSLWVSGWDVDVYHRLCSLNIQPSLSLYFPGLTIAGSKNESSCILLCIGRERKSAYSSGLSGFHKERNPSPPAKLQELRIGLKGYRKLHSDGDVISPLFHEVIADWISV